MAKHDAFIRRFGERELTRRRFLAGGAVLGAGLVAGRRAMAAPMTPRMGSMPAGEPLPAGALAPWQQPMPVVPTLDRRSGGKLRLDQASSTHQFHPALPPSPTLGYGGASYLGPTIETFRGRDLTVIATNSIEGHPFADAVDTMLMGAVEEDRVHPRTAVHLHGGNTPARFDGLPHDVFGRGESFRYEYGNTQEAAALIYHDHAVGITRLNVAAGLAGMYLVRDFIDTGRSGNILGLPSGRYEQVLVVQDATFLDDGRRRYSMDGMWMPEFFGDVALVNGAVWPVHAVDNGWYRFRLLNACNARFLKLRLSNGAAFVVIGSDQGLLNRPASSAEVVAGPGERLDLLVKFDGRAGDVVDLLNDAATPYPFGDPVSPEMSAILRFRLTGAAGYRRTPPSRLRVFPVGRLPRPSNPSRIRRMTLVEIAPPDAPPTMVLVNNSTYHHPVGVPQCRANSVELWEIVNTTVDAHPMHLHAVPFQVLDRQSLDADAYLAAYNPALVTDPVGAAGSGPFQGPDPTPFLTGPARGPAVHETAWKDTAVVHPGEVLRILVPFGAQAAFGLPFSATHRGEYVWHCHILDHEENDMMQPFVIV